MKSLPPSGLAVGAMLTSSPACQPVGAVWRGTSVAPAPTDPAARVHPVLGVPARSSWPAPITHRPTSLSTGSIPPPTILAASTPAKRMAWTTELDAGRMLRVPLTRMFLVEVSSAEPLGSKARRPPASTVTPAACTEPATVTVVPAAMAAGSPARGSLPPLQVDGSDQTPVRTLRTAGAALVTGLSPTNPPATRASPRTTVTTMSSRCRGTLAAC